MYCELFSQAESIYIKGVSHAADEVFCLVAHSPSISYSASGSRHPYIHRIHQGYACD